jgi:hypothetical protein
MKGLFRIVAIVILLAALAGAVLLVRRNQETRRGAAGGDTSSSILPDTMNVEPGSFFSVDAWLNTGSDNDKLAGAELRVIYDNSKVKFVSVETKSGLTLVNDPSTVEVTDNENSYLDIKLIAMGEEKSGAVDAAKLNFQATGAGAGSMVIQGKVMVTGQTTTWDIASNNPANYTIGGSGTVPKETVPVTQKCYWCGQNCVNDAIKTACLDVLPPAGKLCTTNPDGSCEVKNETSDTCVSDADCAKGEECYQPPMPDCRPEVATCAQVMPKKVCRQIPSTTVKPTCVPRPTCLDAVPACDMPELSTYCPPKGYAKEGEMCGGIAGIRCESGLICKMGGVGQLNPLPDQSGICVREQLTCGQRCTTDAGCAKGLICAPIWWPCQTLADDIRMKLQNNEPLTKTEADTMVRYCPDAAKTMPVNTSGPTVVMPSFYGVCRNQTCPNMVDCNCEPVPSGVNPPPTSGGVSLVGKFETEKAAVGDEVVYNLTVSGGTKKVSAADVRIVLMKNYFDVVSVTPNSSARVLKNETGGNVTSTTITLALSWNVAAGQLPTNPVLVKLRLKAKAAGVPSIVLDTTYSNQVTGLDEAGSSKTFAITPVNGWMTIDKETTECQVCASGLAKNKGNANCDSKIDLLDFEYWRSEAFDKGGMTGKVANDWTADFNCDSKVDLLDFETWRFTVFP